jgi:hypothetical protein
LLVRSMDASWSSKIALVSYSRRPISVLLPSSTLPAVMKRSRPVVDRRELFDGGHQK